MYSRQFLLLFPSTALVSFYRDCLGLGESRLFAGHPKVSTPFEPSPPHRLCKLPAHFLCGVFCPADHSKLRRWTHPFPFSLRFKPFSLRPSDLFDSSGKAYPVSAAGFPTTARATYLEPPLPYLLLSLLTLSFNFAPFDSGFSRDSCDWVIFFFLPLGLSPPKARVRIRPFLLLKARYFYLLLFCGH